MPSTMNKSSKKTLKNKIRNFLRKLFKAQEVEKPVKNEKREFDIEKWRNTINKTCHDFDSMNTTLNSSIHNMTLTSLKVRTTIYKSELELMKDELQKLRREQEILERGLMTRARSNHRASRTHRRKSRISAEKKSLKYNNDIFKTSTPNYTIQPRNSFMKNETKVYLFI